MSSYTSGRTVRSTKPRISVVASATSAGRKLIRKHLGGLPTVTVDSVKTADPATLEPMIRTVITFPESPREATKDLADAIEALPGYHSMAWNSCSITYLTAA